MRSTIGCAAKLYAGPQVFESATGLQQGDPFSPFPRCFLPLLCSRWSLMSVVNAQQYTRGDFWMMESVGPHPTAQQAGPPPQSMIVLRPPGYTLTSQICP
jgi:hypothetical protein